MLEEILRYLRNWFLLPDGVYIDTYAVEDGAITLSFLQPDQYFRVIGSVYNDGVYQYNDDLTLTDEAFTGAIWALAIPPAVISLVAEIEEWQTKYGGTVAGPYTSESFGGYSYTKASDADTGGSATWQTAFKARLAAWRKV